MFIIKFEHLSVGKKIMQVDFSGGKLGKDHDNILLNHANLECLKENPQNPGDWDLKP